jgi:predicted enzyme related to lactoylglutathione lyase
MKDLRLVYVSLRTKNLLASAHFYRDLAGIPLAQDEASHYEYSWQNPYLHFAIFQAQEGDRLSHSEIGFSTNDLDNVHNKMVSEGVKVVEKPAMQPWGYSASYLDPDENIVNITVVKAS